jgi:pimeloyl-ACP methyl ester carboxylesterase
VTDEPSAGTEVFVDISGRPVRVRTWGEGAPVLLINGLGANVATWTPLLEQLPGFQLICFDAPGTGLSKSPVLPYRIAHIAEVARRVLDEVNVQRADVLGYSLGGAVAQQLAYQEPERVRRLVLVSSSCGLGQIPGSLHALVAVMTPARHYSKAAHRAVMRMVDLAPAEKDSPVISEQIGAWHQQAAPSVLGYALQMTAFSTFSSLPWLHRVTQPALVMSGTDDHLMPLANSALLAAYLGNARLHVVERWGHYLLHDAESGTASTVADFLGANDHTSSSAWKKARTVSGDDLAGFIQAAPRSAHPAFLTNGCVRALFPPKSNTV